MTELSEEIELLKLRLDIAEAEKFEAAQQVASEYRLPCCPWPLRLLLAGKQRALSTVGASWLVCRLCRSTARLMQALDCNTCQLCGGV